MEHLQDFAPLIEALKELAGRFTVVLSVPNDAFWSLENPYHMTMWGDGSLAELRTVLPDDHVVLHQVSLQGSATVPAADGRLEMPVTARADTDAVPTHYLMAFGPRAGELRPAAGVAQVDLDAQRRWERQRESDLAVFEDLEQRYRDTYERLRATVDEREEFRRYIHELEGRLGLPRSGGAEPQPALPDASA